MSLNDINIQMKCSFLTWFWQHEIIRLINLHVYYKGYVSTLYRPYISLLQHMWSWFIYDLLWFIPVIEAFHDRSHHALTIKNTNSTIILSSIRYSMQVIKYNYTFYAFHFEYNHKLTCLVGSEKKCLIFLII